MFLADINDLLVGILSYSDLNTLKHAQLSYPNIICKDKHKLWRFYVKQALRQMFPHLQFDVYSNCDDWLALWIKLQNILIINKSRHFTDNALFTPPISSNKYTANISLQQILHYDLVDVLKVYLSCKVNNSKMTIDLEPVQKYMFRPLIQTATDLYSFNILQYLLQYNNIQVQCKIVKQFLFVDHFHNEQQANLIFHRMVNHPSLEMSVHEKSSLIKTAFTSIFDASAYQLVFAQTLLKKSTKPYDIPNHFFVVQQLLQLCMDDTYGLPRNELNIKFALEMLNEPLDLQTIKQCLEISCSRTIDHLCQLWIDYEIRMYPDVVNVTNHHQTAFLKAIDKGSCSIVNLLLKKFTFDVVKGLRKFQSSACVWTNISILVAVCTKNNSRMIEIVMDHISQNLGTRYTIDTVMQILYMAIDNGISTDALQCFKQFGKAHDVKTYF